MPIGTRFTVQGDIYKDVYECCDIADKKPEWESTYAFTKHGVKSVWRDAAYDCRCGECAWHWRVGFCSDIREPGPLFCQGVNDFGTRLDGKEVNFIVVDKK